MLSMVSFTVWSNFNSTKQAVQCRRKVDTAIVCPFKFIFHQTKPLLAIKTHVDEIRFLPLNVLSFINKNGKFISYMLIRK